MTAFEPPDFSFIGLQFNKDIFENELTTTSTAVIPDPFPINELDTNNIQALTLGTPVNLYTNFDDVLQLGGALVTNVNIQGYELSTPDIVRNSSGASVTLYDSASEIGIGAGTVQNLYLTAYTGLLPKILNSTPNFYVSSVDNRYYLTQFNTAVDRINQYWRADRVNLIDTCSLIVTPSLTTPTVANTGTYALSAGIFKIPNVIQSNALTQVDLFQNTTGVINLGLASSEVSIQSTNLTTPNTIVSYTPANQQNLFTTTTGDIVIAGSATGVRINSTVRTNIIVATTPASSAVNLYNNFTSGSSGSVALGNNFLPSITTRSVANSLHANTFNLRSNTTANQRIQQTFPFTNSTQQQFYVDNGNAAIITAEVTITAGSTPTVDRSGTYQILAGTLDLGTGGSSTKVNGSLSTDTINAITPASSIINLFTNFTSLTTSTIAFGNSFLVSLTTRAKSLITYFDTYNLRSNTNANQRIEQTFPSTTTQRESFYIDNGNSGVETCRIAVSSGATPLVNNTGTLVLTAGTASLTTDTTNLCNTGTSSVINCNAQLVPAYVYNVTTGVVNTGAIGYFYTGATPTAVSLPVVNVKTAFTASTISIPTNGVYSISISMSIQCVTAGAHNRSLTFCDIYNAAGVLQKSVGWGCLPSITGIAGQVYPMCFTGIYALNGATVANPWQFRLRFEYWYITGTWSSFITDFQYTIVRIA